MSKEPSEAAKEAYRYLDSAEDALTPHAGTSMKAPVPEWPRGVMHCIHCARQAIDQALASQSEELDRSWERLAEAISELRQVRAENAAMQAQAHIGHLLGMTPGTSIKKNMLPKIQELQSQVAALTMDKERFEAELHNIATADLKTWHEGYNNPAEFKRWAQSRAKSTLDAAKAKP